MEIKIVKCSKPKGYLTTNLYFDSVESADKYVGTLKDLFLLKKAEMLEHPLSIRKKKIIGYAQPKKYLLTEVGSKLLLWEEY